jgi:ABC-type branched-subunit amino acid transport system ATPase component/branched-subunit amino acid ABC-type transport system permease component
VQVVLFAVLGLGAGAAYGLIAEGIVLIYRGSGVVNFAQGAIGMIGAYIVYLSHEHGLQTPLALVLGIGAGALIGTATHLVVMRPLRHAPAISRLVATIGIFTICLALGQQLWGIGPRIITPLLPTNSLTLPTDIVVGEDRLLILAAAVFVTVALTFIYRKTKFGLSTSAVAESRRTTSALGISPDRVAAINWAAGGALAVAGSVLIVNITGLQVYELTLLVVPALAAALVGGFRSFPLTLLGGLLIGILESEVSYVQVNVWSSGLLQGAADAVPFVVIVGVLVVRGQSLPVRGDVIEKPPELGTGILRPSWVALTTVVGLILVAFASSDWVDAITTTVAVGIILLSLVVVTGFTGQLSLAQFAFAGIGAWIATRLVASFHVPFELAALAGILGAVPVGVAVGLAALRTRGVNLAVATLGLALLIESQVLDNQELTGGVLGTQVGTPSVFGIDLNPFTHPDRYAVLTIVSFLIVFVAVANLRRGRAGRRMIAVRTNERAAAALGVDVFGAKLYAFGLSAALAALGGVLIAFRTPTVTFSPTFDVFQSILAVVYAVVGGIGAALGSLLGAPLAPGTVGDKVFSLLGNNVEYWFQLFGGLLLVAVLLQAPDGLVFVYRSVILRLMGRFGPTWRPDRRPDSILSEGKQGHPAPATLTLRNISVRFGGVTALESFTLTLKPGEVVGLIGPNGAGKTTLIDAVTGYVHAKEGEILLNGEFINGWSPRRRAIAGIARSFQSLELFESLTVAENLEAACDRRDAWAYVRDLFRPGCPALSPNATAAVRALELEEELTSRPDELPCGRRRLVAIARAIANGPAILLLDEPAAGLDKTQREELSRLIRRLSDEWGLGVLVVEHDVSLVLATCNRVVVIEGGRKIADGPPDEISQDPSVVASYLGASLEEAPGTQRGAAREVVLRAAGLSAGYGDLAVVRDLDLTVGAGEIVALLGPNGAGKTTTLLTLAGELTALDGEVTYFGTSESYPLWRRARMGLAFVPGERPVLQSLSVHANLRLSRGSIVAALDLFPELQPLLSRRAGLCSGGEQQMLALACALSAHPRLLLIDELSMGLAPIVVHRLLRKLRDTAQDDGIGVILVEQYAGQALYVADRAYVLSGGNLVLERPSAELLDDSGTLERAYFHGTGS